MERTLYDRLGGLDAITAVVESFRDTVAADDRINLKFARTNLARLRQMLIDQVCEATGGPCEYRGRSMKEAHAGMRVSKGEFDALVDPARTREFILRTLDASPPGWRERPSLSRTMIDTW